MSLHDELKTIVENLYFQPPTNVLLRYPCIIYQLDQFSLRHANNDVYKDMRRYEVTVIDRDPDSVIPAQILRLPYCSFNRFYTADNLNHFVFQLYF